MRFFQFQHWICQHLKVGTRVRIITFWYLMSLLVPTRKHSLRHAAEVSGLYESQFSRLLRNHDETMADALAHLSKREARRLAAALKTMEGLPWSIAMLIDSTLQGRAGLHTENSKCFHHGRGYDGCIPFITCNAELFFFKHVVSEGNACINGNNVM